MIRTCSAAAGDGSAPPFRERERVEVRDFSFLARLFIPTTETMFSTPHLSPLLDRGGEEMPAARDAKQRP